MKPVDIVFLVLALLVFLGVIILGLSDSRDARAAKSERLDNLQTCIEFDNPVEWCIENFGG